MSVSYYDGGALDTGVYSIDEPSPMTSQSQRHSMAHRLIPVDARGVPFPADADDVTVELCWCAAGADCLVLPVRFAR